LDPSSDPKISWDALGTTVRDAILGFAAGTACAVLLAIACAMFAIVESTVLPVAIALVSIPLRCSPRCASPARAR
jgi:ABC-type nitrate/sulfonate/bicarbonate transport system permease component